VTAGTTTVGFASGLVVAGFGRQRILDRPVGIVVAVAVELG
jgi:hypothetical protein